MTLLNKGEVHSTRTALMKKAHESKTFLKEIKNSLPMDMLVYEANLTGWPKFTAPGRCSRPST
jgi:hypothetical protein